MFQIVEYVIARNQSLAEKSKAFSSSDDSKWIFCLSVLYWWNVCVRNFPSLPQLMSSAFYNFRILGRSWFSVFFEAGGFCLLSMQGTGWACCHYLVSKLCLSLYDSI